jgi:hypothetical protein
MDAGRRGARRPVTAWIGLVAALALVPGSSGAAPAVPVGPTPTSAPIVLGIAAAGKRLTGLSGVWTGSGAISYRFQWVRCNAAGAACLSILGATSPTYTLVPRDVGKTVGLTVYATDSTGSAAGFASLVGPIAAARPPLVATVQPIVDGVPVVGRTLLVTTGVWSPMVATFSYAWERCNPNGRACAPIRGAGSNHYQVAAPDLGHALVALVQAANATTLQNAFSVATPPVVAASVNGPIALTPPAIEGSAATGSQLIAVTGRWHGVGSVGFAFQWDLCDAFGGACAAIPGSRAASIRPLAADAGKTVGLTVRVTDLTGTTTAYASLVGPLAGPQAALAATSPPIVSGAPTAGGSLAVTPGSWSSTPTGFGYTWLRCNLIGRLCKPIAGATGSSYTLTTADSGHTLVAAVQATLGTTKQTAFSAASSPIG